MRIPCLSNALSFFVLLTDNAQNDQTTEHDNKLKITKINEDKKGETKRNTYARTPDEKSVDIDFFFLAFEHSFLDGYGAIGEREKTNRRKKKK